MYDNHIFAPEYKLLKDTIADILNGDDTETDINELSNHIQELYENSQLSSTQYDDLIRYIQDLI